MLLCDVFDTRYIGGSGGIFVTLVAVVGYSLHWWQWWDIRYIGGSGGIFVTLVAVVGYDTGYLRFDTARDLC